MRAGEREFPRVASASTTGPNANIKTSVTVANIAFRSLRLSVDTKIPDASERKLVLSRTSADRHSSVAVTPPS